MKRPVSHLIQNKRGAVGIEATFAVPVLLIMFYGLFQVGMLLWAQASLQNALGQAARYSTIYPTPSDTDIEAYVRDSDLGIDTSKIGDIDIERGTEDGRDYVEISMTYTTPIELVFFSGPTITLDESRRAYTY